MFSERKASSRQHAGMLNTMLWYGAAVLACLGVLLANGAPLFHFDTFAYLNRGLFLVNFVTEFFGIDATVSISVPATGATETGGRILDGTAAVGERTISASRSRIFSFIAGLFAALQILEAVVVLNATIVLIAIWLPVRIAARLCQPAFAVAPTVAISVIVAALGSLPFYVAFLMPDIYAPVGILTIATLTVFVRHMHRWEILLAVLLGCLAVTAHITHLATATVSIPVVALISLMLGRMKWWLAPALVSFITIFGFAELSTYRVAVKAQTDLEAVFMPFLTARLIEDQIGYTYLGRHCPDANIATCALFDALSKSDEPLRLTASHIMFRSSPEQGSFLHLSEDMRRQVTDEQVRFFLMVLREMPLQTVGAFLNNTLVQARMNSVDMTLGTTRSIRNLAGVPGLAIGEFGQGHLTANTHWLGPVTGLHNALYALSLVVIAGLVLWPGALPTEIRVFVIVILLGILANAFLCGGLSQPATRYGSRVVWLLPLMASLCLLHASFLHRTGRTRA